MQWRDCHKDLYLLVKCSHALMTPDRQGLLRGAGQTENSDVLQLLQEISLLSLTFKISPFYCPSWTQNTFGIWQVFVPCMS